MNSKQKSILYLLILVLFSFCKEEKNTSNGFCRIDFSLLNKSLYNEIDSIVSSSKYINENYKMDTLPTILNRYRSLLKDSIISKQCDSILKTVIFEVIESPYFESNNTFNFSYFSFICVKGVNQHTAIAFWTNNDSISVKQFELHKSSWEMLDNLYFNDNQYQEFSDSTLAVNPNAEYYLVVSTLNNDKCRVMININPSWSEDNYLYNDEASNNIEDDKASKYIRDLKNFFISTGYGIPF